MLRQLRPLALLAKSRPLTRSLVSLRSNGIYRFQVNRTPVAFSASRFSIRKYSVLEEESQAPVVDFSKVKELVEKKDPENVIVDVREPEEYAKGHIPGAINIPVNSSPGALGLSPEEFEQTFGFPKPDPSKTLLFYCLAGVRSSMSEELASTFGYGKRLNYVGSFADWTEKKGPVEVPKQSENPKEE
ncbi:hypothetical protein KL921_004799 [Ogataea angusta]|uniref:Rhodanese domain-containing protein n=1 Tax=Pichia angusta TaxID=870730 RepID=A0AAN6I323_PICAN|nr:uncharacterized protein KL928_005261 [Ogataea angusta]KAG7806402.1 hypothetical protein KL921_004799 [Ogataea angusta]KAG7815922.1 hypothetical protein KL928_005261 [Ogataea angusta]KAG7827051.1 hypothetical protein KL920_005049 [Ogataea angusta]KAG7832588.1 hypothetical protein KL943_004925 [Ogataea angusta]KAG7836694.1 hypothetical protein KL942_004612 [Ogataea angusta]